MAARFLVFEVIACDTTERMIAAYRAADPRADAVELRLDLVRDLDLDRVLKTPGRPKLITVRSLRQGGKGHEPDRLSILGRALRAGVEYLDLEHDGPELDLLHTRSGTRPIVSYHDLQTTPADLPALYARLRSISTGALLKIVTFADAATDNLRVKELLRTARDRDLIAFCMGPKGVPSRILSPHWGSAAVYAPPSGGEATAPGQIALEDLFDLYRIDRIDSETRVLGVVGSPVGHSLSPLLHNTALGALDLNYCYVPFEATTLAEFLPLMSELRIAGLSVTLPHKERMAQYLDHVDDTARAVGAVNTVVKTWNRLEGYNTDVEAALAPLRRRIPLRGSRVAVMGAGGAARAVVHGLCREGARVTIFNRTASRAKDLARRFGARALPWARLKRFACDLLVNTTSVGLAPDLDRSPIPASWIGAPLVYDIIYNPPETLFLKQARAAGAETIGGVDMFVHQGAAQFRLFTGKEPPIEAMKRSLLDTLTEAGPGPPPKRRRSSRTARRER